VGAVQWAWFALTGVVAGGGVWTTHFIAMVAYEPRVPIQYDFWGTAASLTPAVLGMFAGFVVAARARSALVACIAGALAGLSVVTMHYMGVAAIRVAMHLLWNPTYVVASVLVAVAGGVSAFLAAQRLRGWPQWIFPPTLLVLAICGLHFTAMTAVTLIPDPSIASQTEHLSRTALALMAGGVTMLILLSGLSLIGMEAQAGRVGMKRLRTAFEGVPAGLALYDQAQRLVLWNQAYRELGAAMGVEPTVGAARHDRLAAAAASGQVDADDDPAAWTAAIETAAQDGGVSEARLADGRWLRIEARSLQDGGFVVAITDVSVLKQTAELMSEARDRAEAANRSKSEFLANMSHEIRTPLNGVIAVASMLSRAELGAKEREMVEIVRSSANSLEHLLTDILDLSRIESGQISIEHAPFHLGDLLRSVAAASKLRASEKSVSLDCTVDRELDGPVLGDSSRLRQILNNLLSNAVKFTERGRIGLSAARSADGQVRFEVADTGIGFDVADKDRILSRFQQADGSITRRFGGSGLGLTISRDLAELMGGKLDCVSAPGAGSTFWLDLPLEPALRLETSPTVPLSGSAEPHELRILLADDHPINRKVVELILAGVGANLMSVENGEEAVAAVANERFDVILMDMQMPVMDGLTAIRLIRQHESESGTPRVPVIMLTANAMPEHIAASRTAGADQHLGKPITPEGLLCAIDQVLADEAAPVDRIAV